MSDETKELAIGEEGVIDGVRVKGVEMDRSVCCENCVLKDAPISGCDGFRCTPSMRTDGRWVCFQEVK